MAYLNRYLADENENINEYWIQSWAYYKKELSWPWSEEDYWKLEDLKKKFGNMFWPYPISLSALYIKSLTENKSFEYDMHITRLADVGHVAINADQLKAAKKIGVQTERGLVNYEKDCKWTPFLFPIYSFLARLALLESDLEKVKFYLKKRESFPLDSEYVLLSEVATVNSLVKAGHIDLAVEHFSNLTKDLTETKYAQKYISVLKSGRCINRETLNEQPFLTQVKS